MDRQTLRDWVHRFNAEGLAGLVNRPLSGRQPLLSSEQMRELATIVETGPDAATDGVVRWRRIARRYIKNFTDLVRAALPESSQGKPLEVWFRYAALRVKMKRGSASRGR